MSEHVGIPWSTRLIHVERMPNAWRCWTALNGPSLPQHKKRGTFLELGDDGSCTKYVIHPDGTEDVQHIKEPHSICKQKKRLT